MKTHLQKLTGLAALGLSLLTAPVPTWAGWVFAPGVTIGSNQLGRYAKGSMVGARYSADLSQYIACGIEVTSANSLTRCWAKDSAAGSFYCESSAPKFQEVVQAMTDSSFIRLQADSTGIVCTDIKVYNGSEQLK